MLNKFLVIIFYRKMEKDNDPEVKVAVEKGEELYKLLRAKK